MDPIISAEIRNRDVVIQERAVVNSLVWWLGPLWIAWETPRFLKKILSRETLPVWIKGRQSWNERKEGYQTSEIPWVGNRLVDLSSCERVILQEKWRKTLKVNQRPVATTDTTSLEGISPGRWGHFLLDSRRGPRPQFQRVNHFLGSGGQGPYCSGLRAQRTKPWAKKDYFQVSNSNGICSNRF